MMFVISGENAGVRRSVRNSLSIVLSFVLAFSLFGGASVCSGFAAEAAQATAVPQAEEVMVAVGSWADEAGDERIEEVLSEASENDIDGLDVLKKYLKGEQLSIDQVSTIDTDALSAIDDGLATEIADALATAEAAQAAADKAAEDAVAAAEEAAKEETAAKEEATAKEEAAAGDKGSADKPAAAEEKSEGSNDDKKDSEDPESIKGSHVDESLDEYFAGDSDSGSFAFSPNPTTDQFIASIAEQAREVGLSKNLYASVMIAQAVLESGSGSSGLSKAPNFNLFGIKGSYNGASVSMSTQEDRGDGSHETITAAFRKYPSTKESLDDYGNLLTVSMASFYAPVLKSNAATFGDACDYLQGHYATDTHYASKLKAVIDSYDLTKYDKAVDPGMKKFPTEMIEAVYGTHFVMPHASTPGVAVAKSMSLPASTLSEKANPWTSADRARLLAEGLIVATVFLGSIYSRKPTDVGEEAADGEEAVTDSEGGKSADESAADDVEQPGLPADEGDAATADKAADSEAEPAEDADSASDCAE